MKFKLSFTLLLLISLRLSAQQVPKENNDLNSADLQPMDNAIIHGYLPNGLAYYIRKNQAPQKRATVYLVERAGSLQEDDNQQGLAHFVEHMAFKGTRDFPKNQLIDYLQKSGVKFGADVNAHTGFDRTTYELTVPTDSMQVFNTALDILVNWAGYVNFDTAEVNSERGVILEEERLRGKNAEERMSNQLRQMEYNNSRYALRLPIGKEEIIKNCTAEDLKQFYHDWYRPDEQAVIIVGDFNPNKVERLIKEKFGVLQNPPNERPLVNYSIPSIAGTRIKMVTDSEAPYPVFSVTTRLAGIKGRTNSEYLQRIFSYLINKMLYDRFKDISKSTDVPYLSAYAGDYPSLGNTDIFTLRAVARPGELEKSAKAVLAEVERARKFGFTEEEFANAKHWFISVRGGEFYDIANHKSVLYAQEYTRNFLDGEGCPGLEYESIFARDNLRTVQLPEINNLMKYYVYDQNRYVIIEAPEKDKPNLPDEKTVLNWINNPGSDIKAYQDVQVDKLADLLPADELTSGKIESDDNDHVIGMQKLTLSNGAKVILKNTDFRKGLVFFEVYGFGGTSIASDADFPSAELSGPLVRESGIANLNQVELGKYLENKNVSLSPYVHQYFQGITGSSGTNSFEFALKLIHLYFTAPRKDTVAWNRLMSDQKSWLSTKGNTPGSVFADTANLVLNSYKPRAVNLQAQMVKSANIEKAFNFYKDRFADASNFTFVFVGNIEDIGVRSLIKKYIGSLPSTNKNEAGKDLGMYPLAGQVTKIVHKGIDDKSNVELIFSGPFEYNQANNLQLNALGEVLQIKVNERLRQQESEVYSPRAGSFYLNYPTGRYSVTVQFTCGSANVDNLIAATLDEVDKIKKNGCQPADIEKFKAQETRQTQLNLKDNGFWVRHLASTGRNNENPDYIIDFVQSLDGVTTESTKAAANKYLSGDNLIKLILLPEKSK